MSMSIQSLISSVLELVVSVLNEMPKVVDGLRSNYDNITKLLGGVLSGFSDMITSSISSSMNIYPMLLNLGGAVVDVLSNSTADVSDMVNTSDEANISFVSVGAEGTPNWAYHHYIDAMSNNMSKIIGPSDGSYGLTYILNGTSYVIENEEAYHYIGSQLLYSLFVALTEVTNLLADFMYQINQTFVWGPI